MAKRLSYRLTIGSNGKAIVSGPQRLEDAARTLAAYYEEGHQDVHALVELNDGRRPATEREIKRLIARARMFTGE